MKIFKYFAILQNIAKIFEILQIIWKFSKFSKYCESLWNIFFEFLFICIFNVLYLQNFAIFFTFFRNILRYFAILKFRNLSRQSQFFRNFFACNNFWNFVSIFFANIVKKKKVKLRFCIDFRKLNNVTKKTTYPLPRIDKC